MEAVVRSHSARAEFFNLEFEICFILKNRRRLKIAVAFFGGLLVWTLFCFSPKL